MKIFSLVYLVPPAILGLITGIGHGVLSHQTDLPISIVDQVKLPLQNARTFEK
ncbi:MAG: hypothetical protein O4749_03290 [Trichodesmium sp. St5_bin2_1]|nr:hypothetical protein [Trichodesmium sp. St5_bin2_1]MDE5116864.1 hypothetical protein [Trichodesmium sp. St2_bin2_1]